MNIHVFKALYFTLFFIFKAFDICFLISLQKDYRNLYPLCPHKAFKISHQINNGRK